MKAREDLSSKAAGISRFRKERFLRTFSEDDFRDRVVRPVFLRKGLRDGRDLCGPAEEGKDALFVSVDALGIHNVYVAQTKKGNLNLASAASQNVVTAIVQLQTALKTTYPFVATKEKKLPSKAILCASGKINTSARRHILEEVNDPRVEFLDSDDLIPAIDVDFPELWFGIDAQARPYLRALRVALQDIGAEGLVALSVPGAGVQAAATDEMFVALKLIRQKWKVVRRRGKVLREPVFEEAPIQAVLKRRERLVLLVGEAGAGKSTSLRRLAYILATRGLAEEHPPIPVLLRASDIEAVGGAGGAVVALAAAQTARIAESSTAAFSTADLIDGRVSLFVDALDELPDDHARSRVLLRIEEFALLYPACLIVVTSRNYVFLKHLPELKAYMEYRLSPISYKQAQQIIVRVQGNRGLPPETSQELVRRLQDVHGMDLNPLLVTVFAATSDHARRDVPANITELFKKYTELMLGRWDSTKGLRHQYHAPLKDFVLTQVAFEMHRRRVTQLTVEEFRALVRTELERRGHQAEVDLLLEEVLNRSDLFRLIGDAVEFRHHLLQEFFAGRGIPSFEFVEMAIGDDWWHRPIVFYCGNRPDEGKHLLTLTTALSTRPLAEQYGAAVTLGLALQACYLVELEQKIDVYRWILSTLAASKDAFLADAAAQGRFPLKSFLFYYLFGRDAVACSLLAQAGARIQHEIESETITDDEREAKVFWLIVGALECNELEAAERLVKSFEPTDPRYMLAIHLGSYLIQHLRVTSRSERTIARRISEKVSGRVQGLRAELLNEFKTELLEIQKGELKALPPGEDPVEAG